MYLILAVTYVSSGYYGSFSDLGIFRFIMLILQIFLPGIVCIYLCEIIEKGHGLGSGPVLLLGSHILGNIMWDVLSLHRYPVNESGDSQYQGALVGFAFNLFSFKNKFSSLRSILFRSEGLSFVQFLVCIAVFATFMYTLNIRIDVPIRSSRVRGVRQNFPLKLLYTSVIPLIYFYSILSHLLVFAYALYSLCPNSLITRLLVQYSPIDTFAEHKLQLVGGLVYFLYPPLGLSEALLHPVHTVIYTITLICITIYFSLLWMNATAGGPRDVLLFFKENQLVIAGYREATMLKELEKIIPIAAKLSAFFVSILSVIAGIFASTFGVGVLIASALVYASFEMIVGANTSLGNGN